MTLYGLLKRLKGLTLLAIAVLVWILFIIVYFDLTVPPFTRVLYWIMPWKGYYSVPIELDISDRIFMLQDMVSDSHTISSISLILMAASFALLTAYLALIYQQRQRRFQEYKMLMLKNREIARRNEFIRYISATIGHEFKNNIGRIKRRLDLIDLPEDEKGKLDANLVKLFADIDVFKRISDEREAGLIDFKPVNIIMMLNDLSSHYNDLADFDFKYSSSMPSSIYASPTLLRTVFENLIDNSIKYKKPGQKKANIIITITMDLDGIRRYASISFRDEGIGMDEQQAEICFYKTGATEAGWGEGLYFVKYVVGLHAGNVRVGKEYTASGKGTDIIVKLPYVEEGIYV